MYDHNVFAVLTTHDRKNKTSSAFKLPQNSRWFHKATGGVAEVPTIDNREPTPANDSQSEDEKPTAVDRLVVTFDELLKNTRNSIQFGTNPSSSDILLGHRGTKGISATQYKITVSDDLRIWLHDYYSTHGTAVGYSGQNQDEVRKKETWILAFKPGTRNRFGDISVHSGGLIFKIEFPNHAGGDPRYLENLRVFVNKDKADVPAVEGLGLDSEATTQAPSEAQTPGVRLIYYNEESIGKGAFGEVHRTIRARDGEYFATKTFIPLANKRKLGEIDPAWLMGIRREFTIMKDNPHPNVMQVFEFRETPAPMIIMAYYSNGNIANAGLIDEQSYVSAWGQILDGLSHLHAKGVVHRDLKPENLLVQKKPFFKVVITDFGLAKVVPNTTLLKTFCGTLQYLAPEVFPGLSNGHGPPVDIWSLGIIVLEWMYGIPTLPTVPTPKGRGTQVPTEMWREWVRTWSDQLLHKLEDENDSQVLDILLRMIEVEASKRWHADRCLAQGFKNGLFKRRVVDGLIVCESDPHHLVLPTADGSDGTKTPTAASPSARIGPEATILSGSMWAGGRSADSPSASNDSSSP